MSMSSQDIDIVCVSGLNERRHLPALAEQSIKLHSHAVVDGGELLERLLRLCTSFCSQLNAALFIGLA